MCSDHQDHQDHHTDPPNVAFVAELCGLLAALTSAHSTESVALALREYWPWVNVLPSHDQLLLAADVTAAANTAVTLGTHLPLLETFADWHRTARAWESGAADEPAISYDTPHVLRPEV